jgi:predicted amidohydrolase YtcJ
MKILYNAQIYTLDENVPKAEALVIDRDRILAVGKTEEILGVYRKKGTQVDPRLEETDGIVFIDLEGHTVLPGLTDAHIHLEHYALSLEKVDCETATRQECIRRVAEQARISPAGKWVLGHGWNQNNWPEGFGTADDLDAVTPGNPVLLTAKSLHAAWVNRVALGMAGLTASTPDPAGGMIGRDNHGNPNGILYESAISLVAGIVPSIGEAELANALTNAQSSLLRFGVTGAHDFDRRSCFSALQRLHQERLLKLRVVKSIPLDDLDHAAALGLRTGFGDKHLRIGSVKAFADGALGPQTAAMLQPYEGNPNNNGILMLDGEELYERGRIAVESGLSLAVHAIGDLANHEVLKAFCQLRAYEENLRQVKLPAARGQSILPLDKRLRHRIEHVQIIHPDDAGKLAELGVIASMQPIHASSDMVMADRFWGARAVNSYAWRTQYQLGAHLAFGSDAPVESPNPFWGLHAAITRRRENGSPGPDGWYPEQRLSLMEALHGFTTGAAYAAGQENQLGKLAAGYLADLIVLKNDPFQLDPQEVRDVLPLATMVSGEWVFTGNGLG